MNNKLVLIAELALILAGVFVFRGLWMLLDAVEFMHTSPALWLSLILGSAAPDDARAALAVEMFCYRVSKYVGAFLAALGGAQAVVFGGGIGENSPDVRARICERLTWFGLQLDASRNLTTVGEDARITDETSRLQAWVVAVDEAALMADAVGRLIHPEAAILFSPPLSAMPPP